MNTLLSLLARISTMALCIIAATTTTFCQDPPPCPEPPDFPQFPYIQGECYITTVEVEGDVCQVEICYCYRNWYHFDLLVADYYITRVRVLTPGCRTVTVREFLNATGIQLILDNPKDLPCPACPDYTFHSSVTKSSCCRSVIDPATGEEILEMCGSSGWCQDTYQVCCNAVGGVFMEHISEGAYSGPCDPECFVLCE